jgi:hypothetical protein
MTRITSFLLGAIALCFNCSMAESPSDDPAAAPIEDHAGAAAASDFDAVPPVASIIASGVRPAVTATCGSDVVNNPGVDAGASLAACIAQNAAAGATVIELPPGRYYLGGILNLGATSNVTIRTQNVSTGPACLDSGAAACAILTATPANTDAVLLSNGASNLVLNHIAIDGNIGPRRANNPGNTWGPNGAYNARIHTCHGCQFLGFTSTRAVRGTGLEFDGDNAVFDGAMFYENGWGATSATSSWSDGLTIWSSANVRIVNSRFIDNSDVDLILGNGPAAVIQNNVIGNHANFAFAALMLDNFNGGFPGNYTGAVVSSNTIDCTSGMCGFGVMLGPHFWYASAAIIGTSATVTGNVITAKQGVFTAGANGFSITGNTINANGAYAGTNYGGCVAQPLTVSAGDSIAVSGNSYGLFPNLLGGCGPQSLPPLIVHLPNIDYQVALAYEQILGRDVDQGGGESFTGLLRSSGLAAVRSSLANSTEAHNAVDAAYLRVLGRHADPTGMTSNLNALAAGSITMAQLPVNLMRSAEALANPYRWY